MNLSCKEIASRVGKLKLIAHQKALIAILWENEKPHRVRLGAMVEDKTHPILQEAEKELREYLSGSRKAFEIPYELIGSEFQRKVWEALRNIPYGETLTYGEIANQIGKPKAVRAVGAAIGRNPLSIIIPCHRVIGANGQLTGFAGGLQVKSALLKLESHPKP